MKTKGIILISILSTIFFKSFSQTELSKALNNNVIKKYYSAEELLKIYYEWPDKFKKIYLYFTQSYIVEAINNEYTQVLFTDSIKNNFDVSQYELYRKENERFERFYDKLGFKLILLSKNEFQDLLNNSTLQHEVNFNLPSGFPTNFNSPTYSNDKEQWINNNQQAYQEYLEKCNQKINLIPLYEFNNFPEEKKNTILSQPDKYIIY